MWEARINTTTACFNENREAGIMICGINWGGSPDAPANQEIASFFSDITVNNYPYRNRLLKWFELLGHPLSVRSDTVSEFERSIIQTNWLSSQSPNMSGKLIISECINEWDNFEYHLQQLKPKIIIFSSVSLLEALNSEKCIESANALLGPSEKPIYYKKTVYSNGKSLKRFRVGSQKFQSTNVIALPHPTGSIGLSNEYIKAFEPEISLIIEEYKSHRQFIS